MSARPAFVLLYKTSALEFVDNNFRIPTTRRNYLFWYFYGKYADTTDPGRYRAVVCYFVTILVSRFFRSAYQQYSLVDFPLFYTRQLAVVISHIFPTARRKYAAIERTFFFLFVCK